MLPPGGVACHRFADTTKEPRLIDSGIHKSVVISKSGARQTPYMLLPSSISAAASQVVSGTPWFQQVFFGGLLKRRPSEYMLAGL